MRHKGIPLQQNYRQTDPTYGTQGLNLNPRSVKASGKPLKQTNHFLIQVQPFPQPHTPKSNTNANKDDLYPHLVQLVRHVVPVHGRQGPGLGGGRLVRGLRGEGLVGAEALGQQAAVTVL